MSIPLLVSCSKQRTCPLPNTSLPGSSVDPGVASIVTSPPADMIGVGTTQIEESWGSPLDPAMVTYGPTSGINQYTDPYSTKTGTDVLFAARKDPVLAPLDMRLVGFSNRSAHARGNKAPYDDLELCFESVDPGWPGMKVCVYHLYGSPLVAKHSEGSTSCGFQAEFGGREQAGGIMYYETSDTNHCDDSPAVGECGALLGSIVQRGDLIGYAGQVGSSSEFAPFAPFRFKVRSAVINPQVASGDPYLHWVQASVFFYWKEAGSAGTPDPGVLTFPRVF